MQNKNSLWKFLVENKDWSICVVAGLIVTIVFFLIFREIL